MPLKSDSIKAINYLNGNISYGGANVYRDDVLAFHSEFYRTHSFGIFEAYYGIDFSLGYYEIIKRQPLISNSLDSIIIKTINDRAGKKFFGGYGTNGGIAIVIQNRSGNGEWRILGIETSLLNEFGEYLRFRKNFPDSIATANMNSSFYPTIGLTSEYVGRGRHASIGYKFALGYCLKKENQNYRSRYSDNMANNTSAGYVTQTFFYTRHSKWTIYYQLNFGSYTFMMQTGFIHQLGNKKILRK